MNEEDSIKDDLARMFGLPVDGLTVKLEIEAPAGALAALTVQPPAKPARHSPLYHAAIAVLAKEEQLLELTNGLWGLWGQYEWRGILDVMVQWVQQIHRSELPPSVRDLTGAVRIDRVLRVQADPELLLRIASEHSTKAAENDGTAPHEGFAEGLASGQFAFDVAERWLPVYHSALRTQATTGDHRLVFAELFKGPDRTDRATAIQAALLLATAAHCARHLPEIARARKDGSRPAAVVPSPWAILNSRSR